MSSPGKQDQHRQDRRRKNWVLMVAVLGIMAAGTWVGRPERVPTPYFDLPRPMVIAHQGGNHLRPGNTLLAFDHAVALGVDVLEMDVHLSADNHVVVIHDDRVERTTSGEGAVAELALSELQALDAAYHWPFQDKSFSEMQRSYRGQNVSIPSLAEVLQRYPAHRLLIELKADDAALAQAVCQLLQDANRTDMTLVASFHKGVMSQFRRMCPGTATSASASEVSWFFTLGKISAQGLFLSPSMALQVSTHRGDQDLLDRKFVAAAKIQRLFVDFWTLNTVQEMRAAIKVGAQGIITDRPDLLLEELGRR